jgi:hypothetical protein
LCSKCYDGYIKESYLDVLDNINNNLNNISRKIEGIIIPTTVEFTKDKDKDKDNKTINDIDDMMYIPEPHIDIINNKIITNLDLKYIEEKDTTGININEIYPNTTEEEITNIVDVVENNQKKKDKSK